MNDHDTGKFTNYVKLEQVKSVLMMRLKLLGFGEQLEYVSDEDLDKLVTVMWNVGNLLQTFEKDEDRVEVLINLVIRLATRLILDHGASLEDL